MNYLILKSIIEATVANFRCKECSSGISEGNIGMLGIAGNSINMEIICPSCKASGIVKAEIGMMNQQATPEMLTNLKNSIQNMQEGGIPTNTSVDSLKDSDVLSIRENLKNCSSIEELFRF